MDTHTTCDTTFNKIEISVIYQDLGSSIRCEQASPRDNKGSKAAAEISQAKKNSPIFNCTLRETFLTGSLEFLDCEWSGVKADLFINWQIGRVSGMGSRDTGNPKIDALQHSLELDDDEDNDVKAADSSSPVVFPLSGDNLIFYRERQMRVASHDSYCTKQRLPRRLWLLALIVFSCFAGSCVVIVRFQSITTIDTRASVDKSAIPTYESWQNVITQSAAAHIPLVPDRESLQDDEDQIDVGGLGSRPTKSSLKRKRRSKFAVFDFFHQYIPSSRTSDDKGATAWDINGPPVRLPDGVSLKTRSITDGPTSTRRGPGGGIDNNILSLHQDVVVAAPVPPKVPGVPLHASEALQCRDSVINFVVNATDGKDECDGLIKAFGTTCSDDGQSAPGHRRHLEDRRKRTRKLWDKLRIPYTIRLRALVHRTMRALEGWTRYLLRTTGGAVKNPPFFFAEDEVFKAWSDARYIVANGLDGVTQSEARRNMHSGQCLLLENEDDERRARQSRLLVDEAVVLGEEEFADVQLQLTASNKTKPPPSSSSLQLPVKSQQHVTEKFTNDALLLQQGDIFIKAANESTVAKEEAAKSKKSISDTADAVSAVFNDPTSIEARTCCASILTVYHEICSSDDEEQVSDTRLFFLVFIMACCGMVKSLIRHFKILWLPEAAGCIIVGGKHDAKMCAFDLCCAGREIHTTLH